MRDTTSFCFLLETLSLSLSWAQVQLNLAAAFDEQTDDEINSSEESTWVLKSRHNALALISRRS